MRIEGQETIAAEPELVWTLVTESVALQQILPGCEEVEATSGAEYRVTLGVRVAKVLETFSGRLRFTRLAPFESLEFQADGESGNGFVNTRGQVKLEPAGAHQTVVRYWLEIDVGGRLADVSPRMRRTTAKAFARRSLEGLARQVEMRTRVYSAPLSLPPSTPAVAGPSLAERLARLRFILVLLAAVTGLVVLWRQADRRRTQRVAEQVAQLLEEARRTELAEGPAAAP